MPSSVRVRSYIGSRNEDVIGEVSDQDAQDTRIGRQSRESMTI